MSSRSRFAPRAPVGVRALPARKPRLVAPRAALFGGELVEKVASPRGRVETEELPKQLRLSLNDASGGTISGLLDKALSICFLYEADSQKYSFYIWGAVRLGGALTVLAITLLLAVLWSRERLRTRAPTPEAPDPAEEASSSATSHQS